MQDPKYIEQLEAVAAKALALSNTITALTSDPYHGEDLAGLADENAELRGELAVLGSFKKGAR